MSIQNVQQQSVRYLALALLTAALLAHLAGSTLADSVYNGGRHPSVSAPLTLPALADGPQVGTGGG